LWLNALRLLRPYRSVRCGARVTGPGLVTRRLPQPIGCQALGGSGSAACHGDGRDRQGTNGSVPHISPAGCQSLVTANAMASQPLQLVLTVKP
jgi:hypothetical protein